MKQEKAISLLKIERTLSAAPKDVFAALTQSQKMNQWFFGMDGGSARVEQDFRVGGTYTINMLKENGEPGSCDGEQRYAPHGEYLEIDPPRRLVFSWISEGFVENSTVTIELEAFEKGTKLVLTHELPSDAIEAHTHGWNACLEHLVGFVGQ